MFKNKLILIFIGIIVILCGLIAFEHKRAISFKEQADDRESIMKVKERDWITKEGRLVHENSVASIKSDKVAKEYLKKDSATNALLKDLKIDWRKVHSLSKTTVVNNYYLDTTIVPTSDSTYEFKWNNTWLSVNGKIDIKNKRIQQNYTHTDTINQVVHYKRSKKLLKLIPYGKFIFVSEVTCADSSSKVTDQTTFIKQK